MTSRIILDYSELEPELVDQLKDCKPGDSENLDITCTVESNDEKQFVATVNGAAYGDTGEQPEAQPGEDEEYAKPEAGPANGGGSKLPRAVVMMIRGK